MKVRKYQDTDKENLRKICIATAEQQKYDSGEKLLTLLYNDYYTENESDNCFVLANEKNEAVGYIICSDDYFKYRKTFMKKYMPQIRKLSFSKYIIKLISLYLIEPKFSKKFPAHLHIDILDGYTGKGSGTTLINTLFSHLKANNIKGIMLGVGYHNKRAINFYHKLGLKDIKTYRNIVVMMGKTF
jgi:ribosomal protein S18 acetylase RimI-like enzyme